MDEMKAGKEQRSFAQSDNDKKDNIDTGDKMQLQRV
jgi:hypothetical protein